ncbi:hypothetical protein EU546_02235 [Candidatus Thorarchaeota archaeon]|nr:MAG: hypothetical protein EU546_02235 [Candidatus Thorarchaeota archaeon]
MKPASNLRSLAEDFAPILHFHPEEGNFCCFPSDPEAVYERFGDDWSQFGGERNPEVLAEDTPCYYECWQREEFVHLRYWFWYNYNRFPGGRFGIGEHIGDWEHVEVRWYPQLEGQEVVIWLLSNHLEFRQASKPVHLRLPEAATTEPILSNRQIHVWVALGSHANYPAHDSEPYCFARLWCDEISNGGTIWDSRSSLSPLQESSFSEYQGRWGNRKSPRSPTNSYNNPWRNAPKQRPVRG